MVVMGDGVHVITPRCACAARGKVIAVGLYIYYICKKKFRFFLDLSKYSLSEFHSSTGGLLFEFNRLQYTLAAPEVFVASANPRVSIVRNTNIDQIKTTPLRYSRYG